MSLHKATYFLCGCCLQRKLYTEFGLKKGHFGVQTRCHECVLSGLRENGKIDDYINGTLPKRTKKAMDIDRHIRQGKSILFAKIKKDFKKNKLSQGAAEFRKMFPAS